MMSAPDGAGQGGHPAAVASGQGGLRTVGVTACRHGEGTTWIAVQMARALATSDARVLLVEGNLRTPAIAEVLGLDASPGLAEFLTGEIRAAALVRASRTAGLFFVGAGTRPAAVDTRAIADLVAEWAPRFDSIVLDLPPLGAHPDAPDLAPALDGVIVVVDPDVTAIDDAEHFAARLRKSGARLFGMVLNRRGAFSQTHRTGGAERSRGATATGQVR